MIEGGTLNLGVVVSEMNDELIGAGRKRLKDFFVGVEPLCFRNAGAKTEDAVENNRIGRERGEGVKAGVAREKRRELVGFGGGQVDVDEIGGADDGAHVGIEMGDVDSGGKGFVDL